MTTHHPEEDPMTTATVDLTETKVAKIPHCDICRDDETLAYADASIVYMGRRTWAFVCKPHFDTLGGKLGMGCGQKLVQA